MNFYLPTKVITGHNVISQNAELFSKYGKRCIIVTGKGSAKACGALDDVTAALDKCGIEYVIFDKIEQNPTIESCFEGAKVAAKKFDGFGTSTDFVIGIGGGSPLDASKAIAVLIKNTIDEDDMYAGNWKCEPLPVIAVGTTAGTGSEVTQVAVITDSQGKKRSFREDKSFPVVAFGDPKYLMHMPQRVMRSTAIDALSHSVESYFITSATELSRAAAIKSISILVDAFKSIIDGNEPDVQMMEKVYEASLYGGYAISVTGTAFPHALGYFLSEEHGVAHGTACGIYLCEFLRYNTIHAKALADELFEKIAIDIDTLCDIIKKILPETDITLTKAQKDELMPRWSGHKCLTKMYGAPTEELLDGIIRKLF